MSISEPANPLISAYTEVLVVKADKKQSQKRKPLGRHQQPMPQMEVHQHLLKNQLKLTS